MSNSNQTSRGGKRAGSGRKKTGAKRVQFKIYIDSDVAIALSNIDKATIEKALSELINYQ